MIKGKGYDVPEGYMGLINGTYKLFASETDYYDCLLVESEV